jgi:multiple sugar transport system substrate-binding protein
MKKAFFIFVVLLSILTVVPVSAQAETIAAVPCEAPGSLVFWLWDDTLGAIISDSIDYWIETYCPGATVDMQITPWAQYWDTLRVNAAGGNMPDVMWMSQLFAGFYNGNDLLLNLQPYWDAAGVETTQWGPGMVDPYRDPAGELRAGPMNWDTIAIAYNKELFDAAGLDYPTNEWTWDDFAAAARALTNPEAGVFGASVYGGNFQQGIGNWIASTGETPGVSEDRTTCTLTSPQSLEALNFLNDLQDEGVMPIGSMVSGEASFNLFQSGNVAMLTVGSWRLQDLNSQITFDWDLVQLPRHPESGRSRSITHAVGYVASKTTPNPDLAANLILFLVSDDGQRFWAESGSVAPSSPNPELQSQWLSAFSEEQNVQAYVSALDDSQGITINGEQWAVMDEMIINIFDLEIDVETAAQAACEKIDAIIAGS